MSIGMETTVVLGLAGSGGPHRSLSVPLPPHPVSPVAPGQIIDCRCDSFLDRVHAQHRHVGPTHDACRHPNREADCFEPLPFDKFLARQNQEFHAAVGHQLPSRHPCGPMPCPPCQPAPAAPSLSGTTPPRPAASSWPHIGDVAPVPREDPAPRLRTVYQFLPPVRTGCGVDLLL